MERKRNLRLNVCIFHHKEDVTKMGILLMFQLTMVSILSVKSLNTLVPSSSYDLSADADVAARIRSATGAFAKLRKTLTSKRTRTFCHLCYNCSMYFAIWIRDMELSCRFSTKDGSLSQSVRTSDVSCDKIHAIQETY